jgi:hypothetical protein
MSTENSPPPFDVDDYRKRTQDLVDAMEETTALFDKMSDNMAHLSACFEDFGATESPPARCETVAGASGERSTTGRAAD